MKCPACKETTLTMTERQGIEIDYCPDCRGVWLDRGELDKLIEKSVAAQPPQESRKEKDSKYDRDRDYDRKEYYYKKKKSFLSEIFD